MEVKTIRRVAFFYNEQTKGDDFIQKNKFRCQVDSDATKSVVTFQKYPARISRVSSNAANNFRNGLS